MTTSPTRTADGRWHLVDAAQRRTKPGALQGRGNVIVEANPRNLTIQQYRAVGTVPARVEICSAVRWVYHLHLVPVRASVGWLRTLTPMSARISALTCSVFLERHVNEETLPSPQTSAASTPSRAIVKSLPADEPREPIAPHVPRNPPGTRADRRQELAPNPNELVRRTGTPDTVEGWKALADSLLTEQSCVFHRNLEISSGYAWIYSSLPTCLKWAGMAAFASHHARLVLYPFRLHTDRSGYSDIPRSLRHRSILLLGDVNTVRATNNAIFDDIFWVHLVYASTDDGIERLRALLGNDQHYGPVLAGFESIDAGRRVLEDPAASATARRAATDLIWDGNIQLLEHEQRVVVQPNFDRLSRTFGTLFSAGSSLSFEARGLRQELAYFSSFYLYSLGRGLPAVLRSRAWPRVTRFDDRWRLDRDGGRAEVPATRRRRALGRREPAPHLRRGSPQHLEPLWCAAGTARGRRGRNLGCA